MRKVAEYKETPLLAALSASFDIDEECRLPTSPMVDTELKIQYWRTVFSSYNTNYMILNVFSYESDRLAYTFPDLVVGSGEDGLGLINCIFYLEESWNKSAQF